MGKVVNGNFPNYWEKRKGNNLWNSNNLSIISTENEYLSNSEESSLEEYSEEELEKIMEENSFFVEKANILLIEQRDASRESGEIFYKIINFLKDKVQTLDEEEKAEFLEKAYIKVEKKNQGLSLQILKLRLEFLKRKFKLDILEEDDFVYDS